MLQVQLQIYSSHPRSSLLPGFLITKLELQNMEQDGGKHWNNLDEKRDKNRGKAASKIPPLRLSPEDLHPISLLPCRIHKSCFVWVFPSFCTQNVITSQLLWNYCFGISFPFFLQVTSSCLQKYFPCFSHYFFPSNLQLIWFLAITKHWACSFVGFLSHIQDHLQP